MTQPKPALYLASSSPRRRELLAQIGVRYRTVAVAVDESCREGEAPEDCAMRLALTKAHCGWEAVARAAAAPVLGADTMVVLEDEVLGKPADRAAALAMLGRLSGREHRVLSAVALVQGAREAVRLSVSRVVFRTIDAAERAAYWDTGEPADKAGAYAIQGCGAVFVQSLEGSYSGVMGLALYETAQLLRAFDVPTAIAALSAAPGSGGA